MTAPANPVQCAYCGAVGEGNHSIWCAKYTNTNPLREMTQALVQEVWDAAVTAERERCARIRAALVELLAACEAEVNEKGAGGFLLARMSDARAAIRKGE